MVEVSFYCGREDTMYIRGIDHPPSQVDHDGCVLVNRIARYLSNYSRAGLKTIKKQSIHGKYRQSTKGGGILGPVVPESLRI
jgi:hypothetical protein